MVHVFTLGNDLCQKGKKNKRTKHSEMRKLLENVSIKSFSDLKCHPNGIIIALSNTAHITS